MASSSVSQEDTNENENNQGTLSKKTMKIRSPRTNQVKIHQQQQQQQMQHHDENEVKSQSFPQTSDSPILNRTRSKTERDKLRVGGTSTNSKLRMQRERRRTKRREAYMPSTEGTSTGEEDEDDLFTLENQHNMKLSTIRNGDETVTKAPPQANSHHFSRKLSASCRASKSPSDLDADDEDNQDYDSASIVSTSETVILPQSYANNDGSNIDNASFRAQFQAIHVAGMQQLAAVAAENDSSGLLSESSGSGKDDVTKSLDREKREKLALIEELGQKDQKINQLEKLVKELSRQNEQLKCEKQSLQNALAKFKI